MGEGMKPVVVLSGVSFTEMGPLSIFQDALSALESEYADKYEIVALVHKKSLFSNDRVTFLEYSEIKRSWIARLKFEYSTCFSLSKELKPYLWLSMHDVTPHVVAEKRAVYCHNPSPFYKFSLHEAMLDRKFAAFVLLYKILYGINIKRNRFVIVQQDWIRSEFRKRYGVKSILVAHPSVPTIRVEGAEDADRKGRPFKFFYPAFPRTFKNYEQLLGATRKLEESATETFLVYLTSDGSETPYAAEIKRKFADLKSVRWLGILPRNEVEKLYHEVDCMIFPSKLETWGMPITEFKRTGKAILAIDLPYAHETVGDYEKVSFFKSGNLSDLASQMMRVMMGGMIFEKHLEQPIAEPYSRNWSELWCILLKGSIEGDLPPLKTM
jgi:glycosyltransferase involved in cell wall biosynthesis